MPQTSPPCKHATSNAPVCGRCRDNRARMARLYIKKSAEIKLRIKKYRNTNRQAYLKASRAYYRKNIAKFQARCNKTEEERQKERDRVNTHNRKNPEQRLRRVAKRRAMKLGVRDVENFTWRDVVDRDGLICFICGFNTIPDCVDLKLRPTVDHTKPLVIGGKHLLCDAAVAHFSCNCAKGRRSFAPGKVPKQFRDACRSRISEYLSMLG